jgi:cation:H+ antiporter
MLDDAFIFIAALLLIIKGATLATKYATRLAESFKISKYAVGFIIIAIISILPETFISINAAIKGMPSFGLGTLLGSNITDLTLVFAAIVFFAGRGIKVESKIIKNNAVYPFILFLPLILGLNGHFSRLEGIALIFTGSIFYYLALKNGVSSLTSKNKGGNKVKNSLMLLFSMAIILVSSYFVVMSATSLANYIGISPILIGMLVVGLGTTMPEFLFSLESVKKQDDSLAVGDILGTVFADATIVVGILALVSPFHFSVKIIYVTGVFMIMASFILFSFMRSGRTLTKKEAWQLFVFWLAFVLIEFATNVW